MPESKEFDADELLALARLDLRKGAMADALSRLKSAINGFPESCPAQAHLELGRVYAQLSLFDRAETSFRRYLQSVSDDVNALFQLGMVRFDSGHRSDAVDIWNQVLGSDPVHPPALYFVSVALSLDGHNEQAIERLRVLMSTAPTDNLYFGKARELLASLAGASPAPKQDVEALRTLTKDSYGTPH